MRPGLTHSVSYCIFHRGNDEWKRLEPFTAIERSPPTCEILNYVITVEKQLRCVNPAMTLPKQMLPEKKLAATPDELDLELKHAIRREETMTDKLTIKEPKGKQGLMWPRPYATDDAAVPLLNGYAKHGCPVDCGDDWTRKHIIAALQHVGRYHRTIGQ